MLNKSLVAFAIATLTGCTFTSSPPGPTQHEHQSVALDTAELSRVDLSMGAGELDVRGGASGLLDGDFTYNVAAWKPAIAHTTSGNESEVKVSQGSTSATGGHTENRWEIALNDARPLELTTHLGAGQARLKLGSLNLRKVTLNMGAGDVDVDLRGKPATSYGVSMRGGVGQATVHVPTDVGISASAGGGLGGIDVSGLEQGADGRWFNPRAKDSPVTITLDVHGGVGQITIRAD